MQRIVFLAVIVAFGAYVASSLHLTTGEMFLAALLLLLANPGGELLPRR